MPFEMLDGGPPLTDLRIGLLERELGIALPEEYRLFLLHHNGGRPKPDFFRIEGWVRSRFGSVHYFFGIDGPVLSNHIDWNYKVLKGRIPSELLAIADDGSGNLICLCLKEEAVYFWDHDEEHSPPTCKNVYFIADTFNKFLESIYLEDLSEEVAKSIGKPMQRPH